MEQVISNFANVAADIVGALVQSVPEPNTLPFFILFGTLLLLLALLCIWLLIRLRRARLAKAADAAFSAEVTFDDISAETAATQPRTAPEPELESQAAPQVAPQAVPQMAVQEGVGASNAGDEDAPSDGERGEAPAGGFRFFKRKSKAVAEDMPAESVEDDVFLLGLEQEMLATRQLYLDGLITKDVYVTETRALYNKAQSRMT